MNQISIMEELTALEKPFSKQNGYDLKFESECLFAKQQLMRDKYNVDTAKNNPVSLKNAILNVAAVGISLNPALAHAYLVPRDGGICLDVSYKGLVKLATDSGAIEWAKAVLVYEGDEFKWRGPNKQPRHEADVFDKDRINAQHPLHNLKGGYCIAKLTSGGVLVEVMTADEIMEVKDSSKAKKGPWAGRWAGEMAKKTLVKRASKSWPQSGGRARLDHAIDLLNEHEGLKDEPIRASDYLKASDEQKATYLELAKGDSVDFWIWYKGLDQRVQSSLPGCEFPQGEKGKMMAFFNGQLEDGRTRLEDWVTQARELCEATDDYGLTEFFEGFPDNQRQAVVDELGPEHAMFVSKVAA